MTTGERAQVTTPFVASPQHKVDVSVLVPAKDEGIQIARRTVAKYRDQLGVLSARMRKRV